MQISPITKLQLSILSDSMSEQEAQQQQDAQKANDELKKSEEG